MPKLCDRCGNLSDSGAWRKLYEDLQDVINYCLDPRLLREVGDLNNSQD
jgi:hypothetical protein